MSDGPASLLKGAGEQLRNARDHVIVGVADAVNAGVDAARVAKDKVADGATDLIDRGKDLADDTADWMGSRPWTTVGIALASGYVLGKLFGRKS